MPQKGTHRQSGTAPYRRREALATHAQLLFERPTIDEFKKHPLLNRRVNTKNFGWRTSSIFYGNGIWGFVRYALGKTNPQYLDALMERGWILGKFTKMLAEDGDVNCTWFDKVKQKNRLMVNPRNDPLQQAIIDARRARKAGKRIVKVRQLENARQHGYKTVKEYRVAVCMKAYEVAAAAKARKKAEASAKNSGGRQPSTPTRKATPPAPRRSNRKSRHYPEASTSNGQTHRNHMPMQVAAKA